MKVKRKSWIALVLVGALILAWQIWPKSTTSQTVTVYQISDIRAHMPLGPLNLVGIVKSSATTTIDPPTSSITEMLVSAGQHVDAGQLLYRVDKQEEQFKLRSIQLDQQSKQTQLSQTDDPLTQSQLRYELEQIALDLQKTQAAINAAEVKSPVAGIIQSISQEGQVIINQDGQADIQGLVDEKHLGQLSEGQTIYYQTLTSPTWHQGQITKIELTPQTKSNQTRYPFTVKIDQPLRVGIHVNLSLVGKGKGLALHPGYILKEKGKSYVLKAQQNRLIKQRVQLVDHHDYVTITKGLSDKDAIAYPSKQVKEGQACQLEVIS